MSDANGATETPVRRRIELLPNDVAARIAAGEVIERPASVVKELVENALDAGAGSIEVTVEGGGIDLMRVRDDGCGIPPDEVADAFERHATSKLRSEHDLYAVRTLGFRGEALAAIAAAADVDLVTRPAGQDAAATVRLREGRIERQGAGSAAPGTAFEVRDLFASLPARRRFLRTARSESRAIAQVVSDYALAYPEVAFRLESDGREVLRAPGTGDPRDAVAAIHGGDVAARLVAGRAERSEPIEGQIEGREEPARAEASVLAGPPSLHRASRGGLHLVANGRAIVSRSLTHAVERAYEGLMPSGRHPIALVRIDVPPDQVDVNVHPTKAEVRFRHERLVFSAVHAAVRDAIAGAGVASAPLPAPRVGTPFSFEDERDEQDDELSGSLGRAVLAGARGADRWRPAVTPPDADGERLHGTGGADGTPRRAGGLDLRGTLPALRPLGQVDGTYIVAESPDGMYLVDQHAAHERVLYERVLARRADETTGDGAGARQPLLQPVVVHLDPAQAALVAEEGEALEAVGWSIEATDGAAVMLRAVPADLKGRDATRVLTDYLDRLEAEERLTGPDRAAATLACRASVMAGDRLDAAQQRALLEALEACETPHSCPHGRPTMLHLSNAALARSFGRPGTRRG